MSDTTNLPMTPHKREVLRAWLEGKKIQQKIGNWVDWDLDIPPSFNCGDEVYRIKPEPEPNSYRWYTRDEFMALFATWPGNFLVLAGCGIFPATLSMEDDDFYIATALGFSINDKIFSAYRYSHDGGKTWHPFGVEIES